MQADEKVVQLVVVDVIGEARGRDVDFERSGKAIQLPRHVLE
ncbi:Uncharacterised protein [Mycobacteroides abscessus subsp. massiliense]|nr:Uncharacterised protein [Mycobacteroides abscessus subsp. massiliense]SKZ07075.1 Uncharacterised protein [Mycobacteroides abscessus subsp. massiliense]